MDLLKLKFEQKERYEKILDKWGDMKDSAGLKDLVKQNIEICHYEFDKLFRAISIELEQAKKTIEKKEKIKMIDIQKKMKEKK